MWFTLGELRNLRRISPEIVRSTGNRDPSKRSRDHQKITRSPIDHEITERSRAWGQLRASRKWTTPGIEEDVLVVGHI